MWSNLFEASRPQYIKLLLGMLVTFGDLTNLATTDVYGKSTALLSCLANKPVDVSGDPRESPVLVPWLALVPLGQARDSLAVVRGNAVRILACVQVYLISAILSALTGVADHHLPPFN